MRTVSTGLTQHITEATQAQFNFDVEKFPLFGPDNLRTRFYGLFRSDNSNTVGDAVTGRYVPHQTDDVLALVEASKAVFDSDVANVECFFDDGHYVTITPTDEQRVQIFGTRDSIFPRIFIRAGYDGKAFKASLGWYRDACRNLHFLRHMSSSNVTIRHTSSLRAKMDSLITTFGMLRGSWDQTVSIVQAMESRNVEMVSFMNAIYGEPDEASQRSITTHRNRTEEIFNRLSNERRNTGRGAFSADTNFEVSIWEAFNAVQGYVQHKATRKSVNGLPLSETGRAVAAFNDPTVTRAESYALSLVS